MALTNLVTSLVLDVYDYDTTPTFVKAIALDKQTRFIKATLTYRGADYPIDENATVTLTVIRPNKTGVQVTGSVVDVDNTDRTGTIKGVSAELSQTALAVKGNLKAQFMISVGDQILRTEIFTVKNGEALDADVSEWAGEYQGYNLDELVQDVADAKAAVSEMESDVSDLKEGFNELIGGIETVSPELSVASSGYINANGEAVTTSSAYWIYSDFVDISDAVNKEVTIYTTIYGDNAVTCWYDADKRAIGYIGRSNASEYGITPSYNPQSISLTLPDNAKYVRLSGYSYYLQPSEMAVTYRKQSKGELYQYVDEKLTESVSKKQGAENSGKYLVVGSDGNVTLQEFGGDKIVTPTFETQTGLMLNNGTVNASESWICSDFVDVSSAINHDVTIKSSVYGAASTVWYNASKEVIGYVDGNNASTFGITADLHLQEYTLTLPDDAVYVRISGYNQYVTDSDKLTISFRTNVTKPWDADIASVEKEINSTRSELSVISEIIGEPQYMNLVDPTTIAENTYIVGTTGARSASNYFDSTDFILLEAGKTYYVGNFRFASGGTYYAFYAEPTAESFISDPDVTVTRDSDSHATITVGSSSVYARFSALKDASNKYISAYVDYYVAYSGAITLEEMVTPKCRFRKVLVLGDSISTDAYGNYKKWVTDLIDEGFFPADTVNNSQHATGFVARYDGKANDFITRLKSVQNPESYDLVIVFGGINDANQLIPVGTDDDTDYLTYFKPALKEFYRYLCLNFINARIGICLPLPCSTQNRPSDVIGVQYTYSALQKAVAETYSLPVLDLTNHSGFHPDANREGMNYDVAQAFRMRWTLKVGDYDPDGIHPIEEYEKKFLAPMIRGFIEGL